MRMIPRIKNIEARDDLRLVVTFDSNERVLYDVGDDVKTIAEFAPLRTQIGLFENFQIDESRTCVYWSDRIDIASDTILEYGQSMS